MRSIATLAATSLMALFVMLGAPTAGAQSVPNQNIKSESKHVEVKPGDSLSKIADANDSTYQRLFYANTEVENPDLIFPGQKLRIPAADEALAERPLPANAPAPVAQAAPAVVPQAYAAPAPQPRAQPQTATTIPSGSVWDQLAQCESGGNWSINTGNGFYGGLQFTQSSWQAVGGTGSPANASREEQISRGQALQAIQGWGAWPACAAKLGLR